MLSHRASDDVTSAGFEATTATSILRFRLEDLYDPGHRGDRSAARSGRRCHRQPESTRGSEQSIVVGNYGRQIIAEARCSRQMDRVQRSKLGGLEICSTVEKGVVKSDEMDAGQQLPGFRYQTRQTGPPYDSHQLHPQQRG